MAIFQQAPRAAEEAIALAKGLAGKEAGVGARAAEAAAPRGASLLAQGFKDEIASLTEMLAHPSAQKDPAAAAKVWDKIYQEIARNAKFGGKPIGPGGEVITYRMPDGSVVAKSIKEPPPAGAERLSMTDAELRAMMPPRPVPPAEAAPKPANAYNEPRPAGMEPPAGPAAEAVDLAKDVTGAGRAAGAAPEAAAAAAPPPRATPWGTAAAEARPAVPSVGQAAAAEPDALFRYGLKYPAAAAGAGAVGTGIYAGYDPEATKKAIQTAMSVYGIEPEYKAPGSVAEGMVNPPTMAHLGEGVSYSPEDFAATGAAQYHMRGPLADRIPEQQSYQRQGPLADRAPTVQRALQVAGARNAAAAPTQTEPAAESRPSEGGMGLAGLLRGRFGEAGKGSATEDRLTAAQEARDRSGNARGGTVEQKPGKDAALHKALEIIHHLIRRG